MCIVKYSCICYMYVCACKCDICTCMSDPLLVDILWSRCVCCKFGFICIGLLLHGSVYRLRNQIHDMTLSHVIGRLYYCALSHQTHIVVH